MSKSVRFCSDVVKKSEKEHNKECECNADVECGRKPVAVKCRPCDLSELPPPSRYDITDWQRERFAVIGASQTAQKAAQQNYAFTEKVIHDTHTDMMRGLKESMQRMGERYLSVEQSRQDQLDEIDSNVTESQKLEYVQKRIACLVCELDNPLAIAKRGLIARQKRECVDEVRDDVEHALNREIQVLCSVKERFAQLLEQVNDVFRELCETRVCLEKDSENKLSALGIDSYVSKLTPDSPGIAFSEGVEKQDKTNSVLETWTHHTEGLLCRSQNARKKSECFRLEGEQRIQTLFSELLLAAQTTDSALASRLYETQKAKDRAQVELEEIDARLADTKHQRDLLEAALEDKYRPLQLAQTRLEKRTHRPCMELCLDPTMIRLQTEVASLNSSIKQLKQRLTVNGDTRQCLCLQREALTQEISRKDAALQIDREEVQGPRQAYQLSSMLTHCF